MRAQPDNYCTPSIENAFFYKGRNMRISINNITSAGFSMTREGSMNHHGSAISIVAIS